MTPPHLSREKTAPVLRELGTNPNTFDPAASSTLANLGGMGTSCAIYLIMDTALELNLAAQRAKGKWIGS